MQIVDTDAFLEMPASSQLLYFHLVMRADDEGFVGSPRKILRMIGCQDDDLKVLMGKRFVITFESGVLVIKHWMIHNVIRMDRLNPTKYQDEKKTLELKENGSYTEVCQTDVRQLPVKCPHKLSKVKLSKVNKYTAADAALSSKNEDELPMDYKGFVEWSSKSSQRSVRLIGEWADTIKPSFQTKGQWRVFIKRNLRPANDLAKFTDEQIAKAFSKIQKSKDWLHKPTLETIIKFLN